MSKFAKLGGGDMRVRLGSGQRSKPLMDIKYPHLLSSAVSIKDLSAFAASLLGGSGPALNRRKAPSPLPPQIVPSLPNISLTICVNTWYCTILASARHARLSTKFWGYSRRFVSAVGKENYDWTVVFGRLTASRPEVGQIT
jgi:hypothetical protein